jgi:hypothetical protein
MEAVNEFFEVQNREFYSEGLNKLEQWATCIDVVGDYFLKIRLLVGFSDYRMYIGPRTFLSILVERIQYYFAQMFTILTWIVTPNIQVLVVKVNVIYSGQGTI